jgi:hypothetical protein
MSNQIGVLPHAEREYASLEVHAADSQWQYCCCRSCQDYRHLIESAPPGTKFNFDTFRHKDEKYASRGL